MIYGRAHDDVTALYSADRDGQRTDWPIRANDATANGFRGMSPEAVADIVAEAPAARVSLKRFFTMWFNPPGRRPRYVAEPG